ncbi:hypothetical protein Mpsy_1521 [Methanolobus psychrophilus R15]|nr:hypothetical protein Mpsy_1521 [Methanolobus psychrophilus R15]
MNENRDFIVERLERQLKEKEAELEDIKNTLRDSILREIRSDLKSDFDVNNRIVNLEHKIQSLASNLNGVMDELLDQKSMIRSLSEISVSRQQKKEEFKPQVTVEKAVEKPVEKMEPRLYRPEPENEPEPPRTRASPPSATPIITAPVRQFVPPQPAIPANRANVSVRSTEQSRNDSFNTVGRPANARLNIREAPPQVEAKPPQRPQSRSEYIVAETDDERKMRKTLPEPHNSCDYIVAEDENRARRKQTETDYETVESRDNEDAVVTVTRRK